MGEADRDPDRRRRIPTRVWLMLGLLLVALFATVVIILGGHIGLRAVGPPPGAP